MSDQDTSVFNKDTPGTVEVSLSDQLAQLIGEGKKYSTVQDALNSLPHAQNHIQKLEEENGTLRQKADQSKTIDDVINSIKEQSQNLDDKTVTIDENEVARKAAELISAKQEKSIKEANMKSATDKLVEQYGDMDKAKKALNDKAQELGLSVEYMQEIAQRSPNAFLKYFDVKPNTGNQNPSSTPDGGVNSQALNMGTTVEGSHKWYVEQMKAKGKDGKAWLMSPEVQKKMIEDATRLGRDEFTKK